jgi:Kef-type K+ transport system membrane component KefB
VGRAFEGEAVSVGTVALMASTSLGFLIATLWLGARMIPSLMHWLRRFDLPGSVPVTAATIAFSLAWLAFAAGSAVVIGAFAAGLLLRRSPQAKEIEQGLRPLGHFFVPIFFVMVGCAVNLRLLDPFAADNGGLRLVGLLFVVAVVGKLLAGYVPFWFPCRKAVIGWAMVPRGAVGLVFAQFALAKGVLDERLFSAVTLMVILTTLIAPPILRLLLPPKTSDGPTEFSLAGELISEP